MKKFGILAATVAFAMVFILMASPAQGDIMVASIYNAAEAEVDSPVLGSDFDQQEGNSAVEAFASVQGSLGTAGAYASADTFNIYTYALVAILPDPQVPYVCISSGSAIDTLLGVTSDTPWTLGIQTDSSSDQSSNGLTSLTGITIVWDMEDNEVYHYDMSVDGPFGSATFGSGSYNLAFLASSVAAASVEPAGDSEFAESFLGITASVAVVPVPSTFLLGHRRLGISPVAAAKKLNTILQD